MKNSIKAIVIHEGRILLNLCSSGFGEYYALPGGGQRDGETMFEAVTREVSEESGYAIQPLRLVGLFEKVSPLRGADDDCGHKIYFVAACKLLSINPDKPTEHDNCQIDSVWVNLRELPNINLFPLALRDNILAMYDSQDVIYIGSEKQRG